jgi:acetyl esterase
MPMRAEPRSDLRSLLTPRMSQVLDRVVRAGRPPLQTLTPAQARAAYDAAAGVLEAAAPTLPTDELRITTRNGTARRARIYRGADPAPAPLLLYLHGGGLVIGSIESHDLLCRDLAARAQANVVALDYRLAPEHPFPAAFDDACDALAWLRAHASSLGGDPQRLAIGGDSAGGALAASAAIWARDHDVPLVHQLLITPHTAAEPTASRLAYAQGFLLDAATIDWFFDQSVPHQHRADWRFAPLHAHDLDGVAPATVIVAECDPLVDEGVAYADRLRAAGVPVALDLVRGVTHEFIRMGRALPEADTARAFAAKALRQAWGIDR